MPRERSRSFPTQSDSGSELEEQSWPLIGQLAAEPAGRASASSPDRATKLSLSRRSHKTLIQHYLNKHSTTLSHLYITISHTQNTLTAKQGGLPANFLLSYCISPTSPLLLFLSLLISPTLSTPPSILFYSITKEGGVCDDDGDPEQGGSTFLVRRRRRRRKNKKKNDKQARKATFRPIIYVA